MKQKPPKRKRFIKIQKLPERRRFVRIEVPLKVVVKSGNFTDETITKNISPIGLRVEVKKELEPAKKLNIELYIPSLDRPVHLEGKVVWQHKTSLEDRAPYDVGIEITEVEDSEKNIFLKYLCDLLYDSTYKVRI